MSVESNSGKGMSGRTSLGVEDGLLASDDFDFGFEGTVGGVAGVATGGSLAISSSGKSSSKILLPAVFGGDSLAAAISCFSAVGMFTGSSGLSKDNQSSSSFLVATTPGTRIGEEHLGQTNFCPARLEGALSFFSHFGHAKFKS